MPENYNTLVSALKALTQETGVSGVTVTLPMAEDEWDLRPEAESYGIVSLDFEANALDGDSMKADTAHEGSVDLFSHIRGGAGWIPLIRETLTEYCGSCWGLNHHAYERSTGLFHWEWTFQIEG